jgi:hypothetical protein
MILRQLTARVKSHGKDELGRYAWQEILLDGERTLLVVTAYRVAQRRPNGCGPTRLETEIYRRQLLLEHYICNDHTTPSPHPIQRCSPEWIKSYPAASSRCAKMMSAD